jgi:hypothetical protein
MMTACENEEPRRVGMYDCGAECWEYKRQYSIERLFAYRDCSRCAGKGQEFRYNAFGHSWTKQCVVCETRALAGYNRHVEIRTRVAEIEKEMVRLTRRALPSIKTLPPVERLPRRGSKPGTADQCRDPNEALATDAGNALWPLAREWRALVEEYQSGTLPMKEPRLVEGA